MSVWDWVCNMMTIDYRESERNRDTVRYRKWWSYLVKLVSCCGFLLLLLVSDKFNHIFTRFDFVATTRRTKY